MSVTLPPSSPAEKRFRNPAPYTRIIRVYTLRTSEDTLKRNFPRARGDNNLTLASAVGSSGKGRLHFPRMQFHRARAPKEKRSACRATGFAVDFTRGH